MLGNAIALNSGRFGIARLLGPRSRALPCGIWRGLLNLVNGISFAAVLVALGDCSSLPT